MKMYAEDIVTDLVALHGGDLVGRTRLQKLSYLLHRCGANFDAPFVYHYYGPYSFDLADGCVDARINNKIEIEERTGGYGIRYSIFRVGSEAPPPIVVARFPLIARVSCSEK